MKTSRASEPRAKRGRLLGDNTCPECGIRMKEKQTSLKFPVNGEETAVPDSPHLSCPKCRDIVLRFDDARKLRQRALEITDRSTGSWPRTTSVRSASASASRKPS